MPGAVNTDAEDLAIAATSAERTEGGSESRGEFARAMPSHDRGRRGQRRQRRKWFSRKYYASVMNIKEFYEDNIGKSFAGILCTALSKNFGRNH